MTTGYLGPSGRPRSRQSHPEFPPWGLGGLRRYRYNAARRLQRNASDNLNQIVDNEIDGGLATVIWTYTHDDNGNLTSKSDGTDTYEYTWDEQNRLVEVELNSVSVVTYEYDSASRMIQRTDGGTTTNYTWDGWDLIREEKDDGVDVEITNYLVPQGEVLAFQRDGDWFYLHGDGLSSTQLVTDENGAQVGRAVYGAWGETLSFNESVPGSLDVRFVGGLGVRNDAATGLIYMRHRWYDSELGRFISRDPIGFDGGYNLYQYPDNPMLRTDPTGLEQGGGGGTITRPNRPTRPSRPTRPARPTKPTRPGFPKLPNPFMFFFWLLTEEAGDGTLCETDRVTATMLFLMATTEQNCDDAYEECLFEIKLFTTQAQRDFLKERGRSSPEEYCEEKREACKQRVRDRMRSRGR